MGKKKSPQQPKSTKSKNLKFESMTDAELKAYKAELERKPGLPSSAKAETRAKIAALEREQSLPPAIPRPPLMIGNVAVWTDDPTPPRDPEELWAELDYVLNLAKRKFPDAEQLVPMLKSSPRS